MRSTSGTTRRNALEKLASLSAQTAGQGGGDGDFHELCMLGGAGKHKDASGAATRASGAVAVPMSIRELEVLLALCKAAPLIQLTKDAESLLNQLAPYMPEAHRQAIKSTSLMLHLPPWESLALQLTSAVLTLATNHPTLAQRAYDCVDETINALSKSAEEVAWLQTRSDEAAEQHQAEHALRSIQLAVSLLGFLDAAARNVRAWNSADRFVVIQRARLLLSEKFMVSLEGSLSAVRNARTSNRSVKEWKRWIRHYATQGRPLGAMLLQRAFSAFVEESVLVLVSPDQRLTHLNVLDMLLHRSPLVSHSGTRSNETMLENLAGLIVDEMDLLDADADYLQVSSAWQQRLALEVRASNLRSFLCCTLIDEEIADDDILVAWLDAITADPVQMGDDQLAQTVLKSFAVLARTSSATATGLSRSLPRLIVQGKMTSQTSIVAGQCLAAVLKLLSQDMVISTIYTLGNVLSAGSPENPNSFSPFLDGASTGTTLVNSSYSTHQALGSNLSLNLSDEEESTAVYGTIIYAIVAVADARRDEKITGLVISMLIQKIGRVNSAVDAKIIIDTAALGSTGSLNELKTLLKLYPRVATQANITENTLMINAVTEARVRIASAIRKDSPHYEAFLFQLLGLIVGSGDTTGDKKIDTALEAQTIAQIFRPLAVLVSKDLHYTPHFESEDELRQLGRDAWFNIVAHGFTISSGSTKEHSADLQILAQYSLPLVDESRVDMPESGIELNTILLRPSSQQRFNDQKSALIASVPSRENEIKSLSCSDCVYLNTAVLVSTLRARAGDCTAVLPYFLENKVKTTSMGNSMLAIAMNAVDIYLQQAVAGKQQNFSAPQVAYQLATFLEACCHRILKVQQAAVLAVDRIVNTMPSVLCQKAALFALLELLTLMWKSCLDAETDEYEWRAQYTSEKGNVSIQLSDDVHYRQTTLANFHKRCRVWVSQAIDVAPLDTKGLLQAYLEDYADDGAYGHIGLGRSFAVEMGSLIPGTDQRLNALDGQRDIHINTASDFMAQYTTRQGYRHVNGNGKLTDLKDWNLVDHNGASRSVTTDLDAEIISGRKELVLLEARLKNHEHVAFSTVRENLRNAAGILSRITFDTAPLIRGLVSIPFILFTKESIQLGISLWLGVAKENPSLEARILVEVAAGWEASVRLHKGFFNQANNHIDPFYVKEEFAPTNWEAISKRRQVVHNLIAPHLRLTHYLSSHFNSSRLTAPSVERVYARLMRVTATTMKNTVSHPLARDVHFHIVLLALDFLKLSTRMDSTTQWRLKDAILSAGLAWFATPPLWSYGSNKLQLKAEVKLLSDITRALQRVASIGAKSHAALCSLQNKEELLQLLLAHESQRLSVWINPLASDSRAIGSAVQQGQPIRDTTFSSFVRVAWSENPSIAVNLTTRFPRSQTLANEVRALVMQNPEKAISEPDSLYVLLGPSLPSDIKSQLKYMLYWAPVNPMAAVTYFMPAYGNHPSIIQYAVRALESHSVDITFFYVPQIVQALRYDALGYVERYIVETGMFSQLFAHQIIWNMKANSFKDEDSQVPDPVKPTLDKVTTSLVSSFSDEDKVFYEREFDFFGRVTGISGTLKPFIKSPKPEKKQKIAEELRKIQVEPGVYLPSNPDGVVIGIDRSSGKPLQSHAKAPYMATFRIRKEEADLVDGEYLTSDDDQEQKRRSYEVWQSAIFKVGDDCRQDVLALQMIAACRGIFNSAGLDVFVFPYRVTATAPGCGVIDVLPNSISRDMLGREAVNGLYDYFISKYGYEDSIRFQEARSNFIKSMAAYSIISYLLQFKDRHNGNIMVDDAGHILHIDFGFCFDIAPGGVKFERAPFKLTPEMVAVMGGSNSAPFRMFEELCIKVFLAARQHVEQLSHIVMTMLDSGLPCFKPQTIQHFKERFVLEKSDREAAEFVRKLVHWSERSYSTAVYDYFQLLTNGIPY
jgi:phosphatidylinositol 4-kinase